MITELSIQGLAIIESLSIEFSSGFNVITGETGAGKSILIRAVNFLMGAKAGAEAVRKGFEQATVFGEFQVKSGHPALSLLSELGIPTEEAEGRHTILVRRTLTAKGRSQTWINDVNVTTAPLKALGATLVDVFGQHENQRLMDPSEHTHYLDCFLPEEKRAALAEIERRGREAAVLVTELGRELEAFHSRTRSRDYLSFRLDELTKFAPCVADFERVKEFCDRADQKGQVRETLQQAVQCLDGSEDGGNCAQGLWEAARLLGGLGQQGAPGPWEELKARLSGVAREIEDLSFEVGRELSSFEFDETEVEQAQGRLYGYQDLFRKHSVREVAELLSEADRLSEELRGLEAASETVRTKVLALKTVAAKIAKEAETLSRARAQAAKAVRRRIEGELHELAMPGAKLEVELAPVRRAFPALDFSSLGPEGAEATGEYRQAIEGLSAVGERGAEKAQFLLATNPGEPMLPLARIASGGELSRIMLALKKALAADADTCVLVFDEIDTGISGRVADVVGRKMAELSDDFQVICISHLPQVAVYADAHFRVQKEGKGNRTESSIVRLTREESAREIARLLSGAEVSSPSLANARSLIQKARQGRKTSPADAPPTL